MHMKTLFILLMLMAGIAAAADSNTTFRLVLDLKDGSRVVGHPQITSLKLETEFAKLDVPLDRVRQVKRATEGDAVTVTLANNDRLQGRLQLTSLTLDTLAGKLTVPLPLIAGVSVSQAGKVGAGPAMWREAMLLYYRFDQENGNDSSGNDRHATVKNAQWKDGAYEFDGQSALLTTPVVDNTGELTWSVWCKPRSFAAVSEHMPMQIIGLRGHAWVWNSDNTAIFFHGSPDAVSLGFCVQHDNATVLTHAYKEPPALDTWHHVAVTINDKGRTLYFNGEQVAQDEDSTRLGSKCAMIIGANDNGPQRYFDGALDEILVLNKALSADDIRALHQAGR